MKEINQKYMVTPENFSSSLYSNKKYNVNGYTREVPSRVEKIIIHCTATDSEKWDDPIACINFDIKGNSGNPRLPKNGCPTCTYHFYIPKTGEVFQLVSMEIQTMNARGFNRESVAICINHGATKDNVTPEQYDGLIQAICHVIDFLDFPYDIDEIPTYLFFHRELDSSKTCPGMLNKNQLVSDVAECLKTWGDNV